MQYNSYNTIQFSILLMLSLPELYITDFDYKLKQDLKTKASSYQMLYYKSYEKRKIWTKDAYRQQLQNEVD